MRAMLLGHPAPATDGPLRLTELDDPAPAPDELVLRVAACGVCRTDLQIAEGDLGARVLPIVPGHQAVGYVEAMGGEVEGWKAGDRAGVAWLASTCGRCAFCRSGRENLCVEARFTGWDRNGGYATRMTVRASFALRIPERFSDVEAAPLLCGGVIGYRSLKRSGIQPGGRLGLFGFGASALLAIQVARFRGCRVFVATRGEAERKRALDLGAEWVGGALDQPPEPLDAAVTFAPSGDVVRAALRSLDRGGTVAINAIHLDRLPEMPYEELWWERSLASVANFTREDAAEFLDLAARIPIATTFETHPLADANEALARLRRGGVEGAAVLVTQPLAVSAEA
jgi:alcohol dehydrogenase, propanol-preferring